ncbi:hypothetical protein SAMN05421788_102240 [Filimonas lacunae]|uniref:Uncharacterized protein n=1 Tax=Filimonas lacunae TaxID=477680 RepID=A0A173MHN8_9BACT|nr:DUF6620 family protein [Filimonas lacunae]BAV07133.1 hypothetical protein FLA_3156 [Filimonas lacunae]SIS94562.1 hypothetical protein SAMN05421788_102240 [Filimonas lacunae]
MSENPLLAPIHGISLYDYSAGNARLANNIALEDVCSALGVEVPIWQEASSLWAQRMQEDSEFIIAMQMGTYFSQADEHPKLGALKPAVSASGQAYLQQMASDRYFYEELNGAREAAYEAGLDGAQWILDNYGISLGDFQSIAMQWSEVQKTDDHETILAFANYRLERKEEYAARFAEENGGNIADDIDF